MRRPTERRAARSAMGAFLIMIPRIVEAQGNDQEPPPDLGEIVVYGRALPQIGTALSGSQGVVGYRDFENRPLSRVGELVENVPGVIATQHSGTGKANQYFLRGFNLDHGTDFAGFVDGVPINLRTHGHGQGYLDLNFLIPELVERIDYRKGPYFADVGDFTAAGTVDFSTVRTLPEPIVDLTAGSFGYYRVLAAGSQPVADGDFLLGLDGTRSNGPWVLDEDLSKVNMLAKYSRGTDQRGWDLSFSLYHADWRSTDQVPRRAIDSGAIDRFGFVDPELGGRTDRAGVTFNGAFGATDLVAYGVFYNFRLTSNFTYFLEDPVNGDQFQQRDRRAILGGRIRHRIDTTLGSAPVAITFGGDTRYARIRAVGLYRSVGGRRMAPVREDSVDEYSAGIFAQGELSLTEGLRAMLGLRGDLYGYDVDADLAPNSGSGHDGLLAPKAALAWRVAESVELYANYGQSFHSNDVRGASIRVDPVTGEQAERVGVLVRARGGEVGARLENGALSASIVGYYLTLGSELVFVGDGGSTEPNDASRRYGAEGTLFWRPTDWLTLDASGAVTHTRFRGVPDGLDRIPNAVSEVISAGASLDFPGGLSAVVRVRHFGPAPLIEDGSARSDSTTLVNLGGYYRIGSVRVALDILNLFDAKDSDISYFYASRLPGEPSEGVEDYHLHPVEPRQMRLSMRVSF